MKKAIFMAILLTISTNLYSSTDILIGISSDILSDKSFDIFSANDWIFGPAIGIQQTIIKGKPLYLDLKFRGGSSSNKIFDDIKTEYSLLFISGGISYRHSIFTDFLSINSGLNFTFGSSDIKISEGLVSYTDSSTSYGANIFLGLRFDIPISIFRGKDWEKQHWHELYTIGIDFCAGYRLMTPLSFEDLKSSGNISNKSKEYNIRLGEININDPYLITSVIFVF